MGVSPGPNPRIRWATARTLTVVTRGGGRRAGGVTSMNVLGRPPVGIGALAVLVLVVAAVLAGTPVLFLTLVPTALMLLAGPAAPASGTLNAFCGHLVAVCAAYLATGMFGLLYAHPGVAGQGTRRLLAVACA